MFNTRTLMKFASLKAMEIDGDIRLRARSVTRRVRSLVTSCRCHQTECAEHPAAARDSRATSYSAIFQPALYSCHRRLVVPAFCLTTWPDAAHCLAKIFAFHRQLFSYLYQSLHRLPCLSLDKN